MATIKDVARVSGYGIATVSKALNDKDNIKKSTKLKIRQIAKEMGYVPNNSGRNLVSKQSHMIGVIFEERSDFGIGHPFFGEILDLLKKQLELHDYDIVLIGKSKGTYIDTYIEHCIQDGVDGIVIMSEVMDGYQMQKLLDSNIPTVLFDFYRENKTTVISKNEDSIYNIVKHAYELGHTRIGYLYGSRKDIVGRLRLNGFMRAINDFGLITKPTWQLESFKYLFEPAYYEVKYLIEHSKDDLPSIIICTSDILAMAAICAISESGLKVPDDISVTGFDNIKYSAFYNPPITTISQDYTKIAEVICEELLKQINNPNYEVKHLEIDTKLVTRHTLKPIKNGVN
jgi:LacI family transcriptional regulator